jgi:hypothetical protein
MAALARVCACIRATVATPPRSRAQGARIRRRMLGSAVALCAIRCRCPRRTLGCRFVPPDPSKTRQLLSPPFSFLVLPPRHRVSALSHIASLGITPTLALTQSQVACTHVQSRFVLLPDRRHFALQCSVALLVAFFFRHVQNNVDHPPDALLSNRTCAPKCRLLTRCSTAKCPTPLRSHLCFSPFTVPIRLSRSYLETSKPR